MRALKRPAIISGSTCTRTHTHTHTHERTPIHTCTHTKAGPAVFPQHTHIYTQTLHTTPPPHPSPLFLIHLLSEQAPQHPPEATAPGCPGGAGTVGRAAIPRGTGLTHGCSFVGLLVCAHVRAFCVYMDVQAMWYPNDKQTLTCKHTHTHTNTHTHTHTNKQTQSQ